MLAGPRWWTHIIVARQKLRKSVLLFAGTPLCCLRWLDTSAMSSSARARISDSWLAALEESNGLWLWYAYHTPVQSITPITNELQCNWLYGSHTSLPVMPLLDQESLWVEVLGQGVTRRVLPDQFPDLWEIHNPPFSCPLLLWLLGPQDFLLDTAFLCIPQAGIS